MRLRLLHVSEGAHAALLVFALLIVGAAAALTLSGGAPAYAADEPPLDLDLGAAEPPAADPAPEAPTPSEAPSEALSDAPSAAPESESYLVFLFRSLGWTFSLTFLALSFITVALFVMNLLAVRRDALIPETLVQTFEGHLNEKRYQEAYEIAKADESFLGLVLSAGLEKLQSGYAQAIEAMQEVGEVESMKLEHRNSHLGLVGMISPMVGLLGTVVGMVASFRTIAESPTTPKPSELAAGISQALITTLIGLLIAIPAIGAYNILKNRLARLVLEVGIISEGLMSRFQNVGGNKK
ncbi:MAG: MotA/TolQ/ExbB proton channel family protein [Thermoguttaceae bacterium]|jgi:biopolymer transport protein ExbB|nr:MotA/TolQ/ExbB proton channel family protein [Thermoguttaceae bacterium]